MSEKYANVQTSLQILNGSVSWSHMSRECGLSPQTIKKFAQGESKSPHFRTVDMLSDYAGFRISIEGMPGSDNVLKLQRIR